MLLPDDKDKDRLKDIAYIEILNIPTIFINLAMAISIIPKLDEIRKNDVAIKLTNGLRSNIIGVIVLYSLSYIFIFLQYFGIYIWNFLYEHCECDCNKK